MPTYSYKCNNCNYSFELIRKMSENEIITHEPCPQCNSFSIIQQITSPTARVDSYSLGRHKLPEDWKSYLKKIKEINPGSNINI